MIIAAHYSFNDGENAVGKTHPKLLEEIREIVSLINADKYKIKKSKEKTMMGELLYSPVGLNEAFKKEFYKRGWKSVRVSCEYPTQYYVSDYKPKKLSGGAFREMDFVKGKLGVEVQFGKYSFMVYNVSAKMTIFHNLGYVDVGVEIVPVKALANEMSSGVSYFEQFVWDLGQRGVSNIDIPVLILGIDVDQKS